MTCRERWALLAIVMCGATVGTLIGWFSFDGLDVDI